ncbi:MAG: enoyl-CoA hydratase/isomerase family protein [Actinomycetales bacterium]|nr:enoyl-CoA hydratase/isomerase family protein [Actinomycetales bacterium]
MSEQASTAAGTLPDEVVTHARMRLVDLPHNAGTFALITLDNDRDHTRPSTFGMAGLASLDAAIDAALDVPGLVGVGVTGKPFVFAVGADLSAVGMVTDRSQILQVAQLGHNVFRRLGELDVPTFAFVNGAAMGGGLELALHCTYRSVSADAAAISLPEVFLGLIPGWGGTWLLPNLIGPGKAMEVIVSNAMAQNKQLRPKQARDLGIFDLLLEPADFLEQSLLWAAAVITGQSTVDRPEIDRSGWAATVAGARAVLDARIHGATPAPYVALGLIAGAADRSRDEGFEAEDNALADLVMGDDLRASLYAFDLVQKRAKRPVGVPDTSLARPVTKVGIVGAGLMASQLALLFAKRLQVPVVMTDLDDERVARGLDYVAADIDASVSKGRMSADKGNRLKALVTGSTDKGAFAGADFVIEAVFENLAVKQQVFAELEGYVSPTCILATNTSSLSVTAMSAGLQHPERVVGFHFFNPVAVMPLLEIARAEATDDATLATAFAVGKQLKKSCVLVKDAPAFVVNRLLTRFLGEITRAIDEGTDFRVADQALDPLGLPMSPLVLLQLVGPAVAFHVSETLHEAFPDRFYVSPNLRRLVEAGLGAVYAWDDTGQPYVDPKVSALFEQGSTTLTAAEVRERAVDALAQEARLMLDEGVVADPADIDLCMLTGAGWPFALGGLTPYLDRCGAAERVTGRRFLPAGVASLPAAAG